MINGSHVAGCILGTAIADAMGLPYEGISRRRAAKLLGRPDRFRFLLRRGMVSDDTEHTCMVAQALIASNFDLNKFSVELGVRFRWWFASLPAGIGKATARSCIKLWLGYKPANSGVFSAGNGPAMRSAIFGAVFDDVDTMVKFVRVSAGISHTDPKAEFGAIAVALAAFFNRTRDQIDAQEFIQQLAQCVGNNGREFVAIINGVAESVARGESTQDFATNSGLSKGVSGYTLHTVPVVIHAWLCHPFDYRTAVMTVIECGGDADTTAAIVGGIVGAGTGETGIPDDWIAGLCEWPASVNWMRKLSLQLTQAANGLKNQTPVTTNFVVTLVRNLLFLVVVIVHGLRRTLPPY